MNWWLWEPVTPGRVCSVLPRLPAPLAEGLVPSRARCLARRSATASCSCASQQWNYEIGLPVAAWQFQWEFWTKWLFFFFFFHAPESNLICFLSCLFFVATAERTTTDKGRKRGSCGSDFPFYLWWRCVAKCKNRSWCWQFCPFLIPGWHFGALSSTLCEEQCPSRGIRQRPASYGWMTLKKVKTKEWTISFSWRGHLGLNLALLKLKSKE